MRLKNIFSEKTRADFKKFFTKEYHDICEMQCMNTNQAGFHDAKMEVKIQDNIDKSLDNLTMAKTSGKVYSPR